MHVSDYLLALIITIVIETIAAFLAGYKSRSAIFSIILINLITNPAANYLVLLNNHSGLLPEDALVITLEVLIIFVEWKLLVFAIQSSKNKLLLLSIVMNLASYLIGKLIF